jgi:ankyrin repeat protein
MDGAWERAVIGGDAGALQQMLRSGADVDARNRHGQTALMLAAHHGHRRTVELLLEAQADLNVTAKYGLSALMLAVVAGHADVARLIAHAGADGGVRGSGAPGFAGKTAFDLADALGMQDLREDLRP